VTVFLLPSVSFAQRQEIIQLQTDVVNLEQRVIEIQRSLDERNRAIQNLVEQLSDTVGGLSGVMERISATLDEVQTGNDRLSGELRVSMSNMSDDVERMDRVLSDLRAAVSTVSQQMTSLSATTQELGSPETVLRTAQFDLITGNYDLAREGFRDFLATFPASPRAAEAQLAMGDSYFSQGSFEQAIIEYDLLLQKYSNSDKTADALYKKGLALSESGQTSQAQQVFAEVLRDFPDSAQAVRAQQELDALDAGTN
jgi:tol-pal system protein YbgF